MTAARLRNLKDRMQVPGLSCGALSPAACRAGTALGHLVHKALQNLDLPLYDPDGSPPELRLFDVALEARTQDALVTNLFRRHSSCVTEEVHVGLVEAISELFLLRIDSKGKQVAEGVWEVVELNSRHVEVKLGSPEHAVILAEGIAVPSLPGLGHRIAEEVGSEVLSLLPRRMDLRLEVKPRRNVEEEGTSTLRVIPGQRGEQVSEDTFNNSSSPAVAQFLLRGLGHGNKAIPNDGLEEDGGGLRQVHGVAERLDQRFSIGSAEKREEEGRTHRVSDRSMSLMTHEWNACPSSWARVETCWYDPV
eukprot:755100-Hanusia_phi.AAC.8